MAIRLQEPHPSLVHLPLALLPTGLAADAVGRLSGSETLMETGRRLVPMAAASAGHLLAGRGALATTTYTAYPGGRTAYEHGVGVKPAGGLKEANSPEMRLDHADGLLRTSARHVREGWHHTVEHLARSELAPVLTRGSTAGAGSSRGRSGEESP